MRLTSIAVGAALMFAGQSTPSRGEALPAAKLGQKIGDVGFVDAAGKKMTLGDLQGTKATVVVFLSFDCPVSTSYSPVLTEMQKRYAQRGVKFVGVCAAESETPASVAKRSTDFALGFPV